MTYQESVLLKLFNGDELSAQEDVLWKRINAVWHLRLEGFNRTQIVKKLGDDFNISPAMGYQLYKQATDLYGELEINKDAERNFIAQKLLQIAKDHEESDIEFSVKCLVDAGKFMGLDKFEEQAPPLDMPVIILSDDPSSLTQDISHEEDE